MTNGKRDSTHYSANKHSRNTRFLCVHVYTKIFYITQYKNILKTVADPFQWCK